jgi:hypothetical protein
VTDRQFSKSNKGDNLIKLPSRVMVLVSQNVLIKLSKYAKFQSNSINGS